ncbi:hypothetical protein PATY110618_01270 [Paenibacillus typhae]|uniref:Uncharacterized protein n=1 Tax=Paenibacillus typhae TaxID=1174501 RepID=A0A1G8IIZ3_9BACL|nr:hypothetical protein SAMN05216192_103258 [Paenibacillus typhae]
MNFFIIREILFLRIQWKKHLIILNLMIHRINAESSYFLLGLGRHLNAFTGTAGRWAYENINSLAGVPA